MSSNIAQNNVHIAQNKILQNESEWRPPCSNACPAGTDVRGYIAAVSQGRYIDAFKIIREVNPFGSACGRICPHACEENCRRNEVDKPLAARLLKRFIYEQVKDYRKTHRSAPEILLKTSGKRVAIVGGGPSGFTAARDLAMKGHSVEIFEREDKAGGMLMNALPKYRLPRESLMEDIDSILKLGITLRTGKALGKDFSIDELQAQGFDAIILAVGLQESNSLPIQGADADNVLMALPFLRAVAKDEFPKIGKKVIVVGGGNVAIDVARCAKRIGAEKVTMVCLESRDIIPASPWEVKEAEEEGIEINPSWGPKCIELEDGNVCGLTCHAVESLFDEKGHFSPSFYKDQIAHLEADTIILAIGQHADLDFADKSGIKHQGFRLVVNPDTLQTSLDRVFACGEVAAGPGSAIQAVAHGRKAAQVVHNYLETGRVEPFQKQECKVVGRLDKAHIQQIPKKERKHVELLSPEKRLKGFMEFEEGYSEAEAMAEARRCMNCGLGAELTGSCAACLTCVRECPFGVPVIKGNKAVFSEDFCVACGICATVCPREAINIRRFPKDWLEKKVTEFLKNKTDGIVRFDCINKVKSQKEFKAKTALYIDCVASLSDLDLLKIFAGGAKGIVIQLPDKNKCEGCGKGVEGFVSKINLINERLAAANIEKSIKLEKEA